MAELAYEEAALTDSDASASVDMLPVGAGRRGPTAGPQWRCRIKVGEHWFDVQLTSRGASFDPGRRTGAAVKFLDWAHAAQHVADGDVFEIWERTCVARGTLTEVKKSH